MLRRLWNAAALAATLAATTAAQAQIVIEQADQVVKAAQA